MKRPLTLIELIISFFIIAIIASFLSFGFLRYYRESGIRNSLSRIEKLLSQAEVCSSMAHQQAEVLLTKEGSSWSGAIKPWGDEEISALDVFTELSSSFVVLDGIEHVQLEGTEVSELSLLFFPICGIDPCYISAKNSAGGDISFAHLGIKGTYDSPITLTIQGKAGSRTIDLSPYSLLTKHLPIPQEYQDLET